MIKKHQVKSKKDRHFIVNVVPARAPNQTRVQRFQQLSEIYDSQLEEQERVMASSRQIVDSVYSKGKYN